MVTTDHGGPLHSKLNFIRAYAELKASREIVPDVLQFYGMELNMPAMDHHTLIIPQSAQEASMLQEIESRFDANEAWPEDPARDEEAHARRALEHMSKLPLLPVLFANHPARSAKGVGVYGSRRAREFRNNHDLAPDLYRGMEGAPGHQAGTLAPDGTPKVNASGKPDGFRGSYRNPGAHTFGGFDQMTAIVGGLWDSLLGKGGGSGSWRRPILTRIMPIPPARFRLLAGEYQKTYVHAQRSYAGVLDGLRSGRIFAVAGDLVNELDVHAKAGARTAAIGETLSMSKGQPMTVTIRFRDPDGKNFRGENPRVARVDLIRGDVRGCNRPQQ